MFLPEAIVPRESGKEQTPLVRQGRPERLPLSYAQQRLWFIDRLKEGTGTEYNALGALRLRGELYREALERTINTIVGRHESLRTHFAEIDGEALQVIERELRIEVPVEDLSELEEGEQQERVQAAMRREREQPFDLAQGPVLRMKLLRLGEQEHILLRTMHHIVSDGWSEGVFNREFMILYEAYREGREDPLKPLTVQYADFAIWQRKWLDSGVLDEGLAYWKEQLRGIPERLELPTDRARPAVQTFGAEVYQVSLSKELTTALKRISQANQATLYMTLLAGFGVLLSRYSGQDDIVVGSPIANRQEEQLEEMIGFFVNTLVMRVRVRPSMSFEELLGEVRRTALEAYQHQDVPFERLVEELSPQRSLNTAPIFQVVFALQNAPRAASRMKGLQVEAIRGEEPRVRTDLEVHAWEEGGRIELYWLYNRDLFDRWRMEQMAGHYERVLEAVVANPVQVIGSLELLSSEERRQILEEWNDTKREVPVATLPVLFEEQVERTPGAVAVVYEEQSLTYRELNERANQLAHYLMERRIGPEDLVALAVPRSLEMVVALLGILKAGAAYLPLDPEYPEERLRFMVEDARPVCVITTSEVKLHVPEDGWRILLDERETGEALAGRARSNPLDHERTGALTPQNPAYVIYTSGSMGVPKAVTVSHRNLLTSTLARLTCYQESVKRFLLVSSFSFDSSVAGIFWTLSQGGELHLLKEGSQRDAGLLVECINISEITHLLCLPSLYGALLALEPDKSLRSLRVVILAGEECPGALLARHERINPWVTHYNEYGPTENTVWSTVYQYCSWQRNAKVPIGRPIWNTRVYVLDGSLGAVPVGVAGELYIAGAGLARGYLKRPGLTAERFVANPFESDGSRMYRTGDLARWREDGNLEFLGRVDQQVKIRGFRVELGEIEAVLREQDGVQEAVVVAREDEPGEKRLVGYVVGAAGKSVDASALRQELTKKLPDYMVPAAVMVLERIPLTANGKVDRKALPAPEFISTSDYREGRTPEEEILCGLFAEVLGVSRVGLDDNFFEMGGHSLLATRLVSRIRATLGVELAIRTLFEWPRVGELGPRLRESGKEQTPLVRQERPERLPLSYAQQRLWFIDQLEEESTEYNVPQALRLRGELYREALERTINTIVGRHESLRTHFAEIDGEALQVIERELRIEVPVEDLSELEEGEQQERVQAAMRREREQPFDLAQGPVLRMKLLRLGEQEHILLRTMHHIVSDGWSEGVFNREFMILYEAYREGREDPLKPLTVQYADFAIWQRKWLDSGVLDEGLAYWKEQLRGIPERLELPTDRARPAVQTFGAEVYQVSLSKELTTALKRISQANQATLYMTLLAGFGVLLSRYSGQDDIVVGSPIANRQEEQLEEMIGFFVNTLVMRVRVRPSMSFEELLGEVRRTALEAYQHQDVPFERLVEELSPQRSLNTAPIFQVVFALQNAPRAASRMKGLQVEAIRGEEPRVRTDLEVHAWERDGGIEISWLYNRDLFDRWRMEQMAGHYERVLEAVVANPVQVIGSLELLSSEERRQILEEWNDTKREVPVATLPVLFEEQVERTPGAVAVVYEEQSLTYRELNERANQLAHYLMERRIGPEDLVALAVPRSLEMVVALLGILKAGAAYLPLDPEYPEERLRFMVEDARPVCVITTGEVKLHVPEDGWRILLDERETGEALAGRARSNPLDHERTGALTPQNPAYVIYTSGSSGNPKGVVVTHYGIASLAETHIQQLDISEARILQLASLSFDVSVFEIVLAILSGSALIVLTARERRMNALVGSIHKFGVTHAAVTPVMLAALLKESDGLPLDNLICGGEACSGELAARWSEGRRMINSYGPTETTVCATMSGPLSGEEVPPIGRPIWNTRVYVLDGSLGAVPVGVAGELYIAGAGLARGYLKRPGLTAERFVANPFESDGSRMYRTGDLARWREDGNLEFLGRVDQQVKIRGFRVELGEIEAVLREQDSVQEAVVVAREDEPGEKRLVGYVIRERSETEHAEARASQIREWQRLYESIYQEDERERGDFNIAGWESSYTGEPIPEEEMRIWVEETVERVRELKPHRVLEVGCGTGLLLTRLAGDCGSYVGLDFSAQALGKLQAYLLTRADLKHVELREGLAHELSFIDDDSIDLVILNSVVQYFPDVDYLLEVLGEAVRVTRRAGHIFVGDVRSLALLEAYHTSVQLCKAKWGMSVEELRQRIRQGMRREEELAVDAKLFRELGRRWDKMGRVEILLKAGAYDNELSRFRYDVVMRVGEKKEVAAPEHWVNWDEGGRWREELEETVRGQRGVSVGVHGIRDRRAAGAVGAVRMLRNATNEGRDVEQLRAACAEIMGEDPDAMMQLARRLEVKLCWQGFGAEGLYDGIFNPRWEAVKDQGDVHRSHYRQYGNTPSRNIKDEELGRVLQDYLTKKLPDHMVPAAVMVLERIPLTANGKVDRKALPAPEFISTSDYREGRTPEEEILCGLFAEVLGVSRVGLDDNFFEMGGHSLLATRLVSRIRATLGVELAIRTLFEWPRVGELGPRLRESGKEQTPLVRQERPERLPLSYAQQRLWFIDQLEEESTEYNVPQALRLRGELYREALERTINTIVGRHESLRTHFAEIDGEALQVIERELRIEVPVEDLSELEEGEQQERVQAAMRREREQPFDLAQGPVLRMKLLRLGEQEHILLRTMHHIVSDGWSEGVFNREFMILYEAYREGREDPLKPLTVQYADFAIWQRKWLDSGVLDEGLAYWKEQLRGIPERLELPTDRARPAVQTFGAEVYQVSLSKELTTALKRISQANQATLYMTLLAGFGVLLSRYSGQDDIVVGSPIANRQEEQLEEMIGFFVNTLVMRVRVRPSMSFEELLGEVRRTALEAYQHQDVPFERLVEELSPQRSLNTAPIFQVVFALQNAPRAASRMKGLQVEAIRGEEPRVRTDLEVHAWERDGGIEISWLYNRDLFDRWRMEQMAGHYERVLEAVVANPVQVIGSLELLSSEERRQILEEWNDTKREVPVATLPVLFEEQVERTPGAVAVVYEEQSLTYRELNERANQLAHYLMERRIGPEDLVALAVPRSLEMVVALLGILKAGAAYLPLDPEYPEERLRFMVEDARPVCVITTGEVKLHVPEDGWRILLDERETGEALAGRARSNPLDHERTGALTPQNPAYVIYTSGSTGKPKAVVVCHFELTNYISYAKEAYEMRFGLGAPINTSMLFDATATSLYLPLVAGRRVLLLAEDRQIELLAELLAGGAGLTLVKLTPAHLQALRVLLGANAAAVRVRRFVVGGEPLNVSIANFWLDRVAALRIVNEYGPTETVVGCCVWELGRQIDSVGDVPIGRPIWNTRVYVLDGSLGAVPVGVAGELYIAGAGLARGYLKRPGLTAERFVANPFESDGSRMYRTGDLARWREDGNLEFLGRVDQQVKIRGFRVELGEIEAVLREQDSVQEAVVVAREDEPGEKRLVGYVVGAAGKSVDASALRQELTKKLPDYMVPAAVMVLERIPLTANGKVDRKALPAPEFISTSDYREGRTPEEEILCGLFAEVLGVSRVGLDDNFFEMGGDSIVSIQLVSRARKAGLIITPREVFQRQTVEGLAAIARGLRGVIVEQESRVGTLPLIPIMRWLEERGAPINRFSQSRLLQVPGRLKEQHLRTVLQAVLNHHDALRLRLIRSMESREWELEIAAVGGVKAEFCLRRVDVVGLDEVGLHACISEEAVAAEARLNPEAGMIVQGVWFDAGPEKAGRLLLVIHHLAVDGVSWRILVPDLAGAWQAVVEGRKPDLGERGTSFQRWAKLLSEHAQDVERMEQLPFWTGALKESAMLVSAQLDSTRDTLGRAGHIRLRLPVRVTDLLLTTVSSAFHAGINDVLLTGLVVALAQWRRKRRQGGSNAVVIDLEGHGREEIFEGVDLSRTVGWFTSQFPVRLDPGAIDLDEAWKGGRALGQVLKVIKEQLRAVPNGGLGYGMLRYLNSETGSLLAGLGTPQIGFNYLGRWAGAGGGDWGAAPEEVRGGIDSEMPLAHCVGVNASTIENPEGPTLTATWTWAPALLSEQDVGELAEGWFHVLEALVRHAAQPGAGGLTPSDIPLTSLTQAEIELVERECLRDLK